MHLLSQGVRRVRTPCLAQRPWCSLAHALDEMHGHAHRVLFRQLLEAALKAIQRESKDVASKGVSLLHVHLAIALKIALANPWCV